MQEKRVLTTSEPSETLERVTTLQNKSEAGTLAGSKFFMFICRWLAVDFCQTIAVYDYYKSMITTNSAQTKAILYTINVSFPKGMFF